MIVTVPKICMLAIMALVLLWLLRSWKSELVPLVRVGCTVLFAALLLESVAPLLTYLSDLTEGGGITESRELLLRALGIALLSKLTADICRDSGESGLATGVETAGRLEILLLSLPLLQRLLAAAGELAGVSG